MKFTLFYESSAPRLSESPILAFAGFAWDRFSTVRSAHGTNRFFPYEEIQLLFQNDDASAAAHKAVMEDPTPTDVISLPYAATPVSPAYGELLINPLQASRQALKRDSLSLLSCEKMAFPRWSRDLELLLYVAHGLDHLSGADDATAPSFRRMRKREIAALKDFFASFPIPPHKLSLFL